MTIGATMEKLEWLFNHVRRPAVPSAMARPTWRLFVDLFKHSGPAARSIRADRLRRHPNGTRSTSWSARSTWSPVEVVRDLEAEAQALGRLLGRKLGQPISGEPKACPKLVIEGSARDKLGATRRK